MFVDAIQCCTTLAGYLINILCLLNEVDLLDTLTEVALVNLNTHNRFVDILKLCEREEFARGNRLSADS